MKPQNFEEKVVWYSLIGTYGFYFLGAQYIVIPAVAWFLTLYLSKKLWNQTENTPTTEKIAIPSTTWVWIAFILVMELALIMGHIDFELGLVKIIFSSVNNWARQFALMALFPLIGCLNIRPQLLYRAVCIICLQSLVFVVVSYLLFALHLPEIQFISPLARIARGSEELYFVDLYDFEYGTNMLRLKLLAPWPPESGLIGNIYFFLACQETDRKWRLIGIVGAIAMVVSTVSRAAIVCIPTVIILTWILGHFTRPITYITAGVMSFIVSIFTPHISNFLQTSQEQFHSIRSSSSEVRGFLDNLALNRWQEATLWGHGIVQPWLNTPGIGTHHTWIGLLFTRGLVGFLALLVPMIWSFMDLLYKAQKSAIAKVGLSVVLVLFIFGPVIDVTYVSYIYWPGLVLLGIAFKEKDQIPRCI